MLSEDDQWDTKFSIGKFLDMVIDGNSKFVLYAIDKFYIEVESKLSFPHLKLLFEYAYGKQKDVKNIALEHI